MQMEMSASPEEIIGSALLVILTWGGLYSACAVVVARRLGSAWLWRGWVGAVLLLCGVVVLRMRSFGPIRMEPGVMTYMLLAFIGIPTGLATFAIWRGQRRVERRSWLAQTAIAVMVFLLAVPLGLLVGAIPDILPIL